MRMSRLSGPVAIAAILLATACHQPPPASDAPATPAAAPSVEAAATPAPPVAPIPALPGLSFGQPIPAGGAWRADAAQISDECRTYTARAFPRSYAIVIAGRLERVTFGRGSGFRLPNGLAPGSTEDEVRRALPDLMAEPHKYAEAPAKYLTSSRLAPDAVGLRFEIDPDGTVGQIHIGLPSSLSLVEGCA